MTKIICARLECKHNKDTICKARCVEMSDHFILTVWEGRQEFLKCKTYEMSETAKAFRRAIEEVKK